MDKFNYRVDATNFSGQDGATVELRETDGGFPTTRRDVVDARGTISVVWNLNPQAFAAFVTFFNETIKEGSLAFLIDVAFDYSAVEEREVKFIPGSIQIGALIGMTRTVSANLEIVSVYDAGVDEYIMSYMEGTSIDGDVLDALSQLINVDLGEI